MLTGELREYRSDLKLCKDIRDRSGMLDEKLAVIDKERGREVREK